MAAQRIRCWRWKVRSVGLRMGSVDAENGGAEVGEEEAGKGALGRSQKGGLAMVLDDW